MPHPSKNIRIVIPASRADATLRACLDGLLAALAFSDSWEIIIADNGGNTILPLLEQDYPLTIVRCDSRPSAAFARNAGAAGYTGGVLVFIDSDVVCDASCIEALVRPVASRKAHAAIGNYTSDTTGLTFAQRYKQLYIHNVYNRPQAPIRNDFWTAIAAVDAATFHRLGGFDIRFRGANGEDQEFGIRLTRHHCNVVAVREALGRHLNPYTVYRLIRNDFRKGVTAVGNSLQNNVALSDNRHARMPAILAVVFAAAVIPCAVAGFFFLPFGFLAILFFSAWMLFRTKLAVVFLRHGGILFFCGALTMMFLLDLVRACCVAAGVFKNMQRVFSRNTVPAKLKAVQTYE